MHEAWIASIRAAVGQPVRSIGLFGWLRWHQWRPAWIERPSPLAGYFDTQMEVVRRGRVVWACVVKANAGLYAPGRQPAPGVAVWSPDPWFDGRVRVLKHVADHVDALRRFRTDDDASLAPCIKQARDDERSHPRCVVPGRLTGERLVYCGPIYIAPTDLPVPLLAQRWLPVFIDEASEHVRVVPARSWPKELVARWKADAERRACADFEPYSIPEQRSTWLSACAVGDADDALAVARDALDELDFPTAACAALLVLNDRPSEAETAQALLLEIVDCAATSLALFDGLTDARLAALGTAAVLMRYGRGDEARMQLDRWKVHDSEASWMPRFAPGPYGFEAES